MKGMIMQYILAFYEIDRAYGGAEEGGWWYETGTRVRLHRVMRDETAANACAARANRLLDHLQRHRRPISSLGYRGERHRLCVFEHFGPRNFPQSLPAYE